MLRQVWKGRSAAVIRRGLPRSSALPLQCGEAEPVGFSKNRHSTQSNHYLTPMSFLRLLGVIKAAPRSYREDCLLSGDDGALRCLIRNDDKQMTPKRSDCLRKAADGGTAHLCGFARSAISQSS